jgi:hypothetical protein
MYQDARSTKPQTRNMSELYAILIFRCTLLAKIKMTEGVSGLEVSNISSAAPSGYFGAY